MNEWNKSDVTSQEISELYIVEPSKCTLSSCKGGETLKMLVYCLFSLDHRKLKVIA